MVDCGLLWTSQADGKTVTDLAECDALVPTGQVVKAVHIGAKEMSQSTLLVGEIDCTNHQDRCFYKHGILNLVPGVVSAEVSEGYVCVKSDEYVHAVALEGEAVFEDNYFSLMPGEEKIVKFRKMNEGIGEIGVEACKIFTYRG